MRKNYLYFDPKKFCPDDIATRAVNNYAAKHHCSYAALLLQLDLTDAEFKLAIEEQIKNIPNIKNTVQTIAIGDLVFDLRVRKDGTAILCKTTATPTPDIVGCMNPDATNYNADATSPGSCTFDTTEVVFDTASAIAAATVLGSNIFASDISQFASWAPDSIELNLGRYYFTPSPGMSDAQFTLVNNFLTATGADIWCFVPIVQFQYFPTFYDKLIAKFGAKLKGFQLDQESSNTNDTAAWIVSFSPSELIVYNGIIAGGGTQNEAINAIYVARCLQVIAAYPSIKCSWDVPNTWNTAAIKVARMDAIRPRNETDYMRQYHQISPDSVQWILDDHVGNLAKINYYINTLLPGYIDRIFVTAATKFPNIAKLEIDQWHDSDTGTTELSYALRNICESEYARVILSNTNRFSATYWMQHQELMQNDIEFTTLKRISPAFRFAFTFPISAPYSGLSAQGFSDGANSFGALMTNQSGTDITIPANVISIPGKTITGLISHDRGWATSLGDNVRNEIGTDSVFTIKKYGNAMFTFLTV